MRLTLQLQNVPMISPQAQALMLPSFQWLIYLGLCRHFLEMLEEVLAYFGQEWATQPSTSRIRSCMTKVGDEGDSRFSRFPKNPPIGMKILAICKKLSSNIKYYEDFVS